jgi:hypothetical protein
MTTRVKKSRATKCHAGRYILSPRSFATTGWKFKSAGTRPDGEKPTERWFRYGLRPTQPPVFITRKVEQPG